MTETAAALPATPALRLSTVPGRWTVAATVLGSGMVALDATVVGIALPAIGRNFHASVSSLQWVVDAYTLTLAGLLLLGGTLGDSYGRRKLFVIGTVWFAVASLLCGVAPSVGILIAARALQGVGGALLTPGSLAILQASFAQDDRMAAIGAWSGLGGAARRAGCRLHQRGAGRDHVRADRGVLVRLGLGGGAGAAGRGAGPAGLVRPGRGQGAQSHAAARPVQVAPVHRGQRGDVCGLRRARRAAVPGPRRAAGGP